MSIITQKIKRAFFAVVYTSALAATTAYAETSSEYTSLKTKDCKQNHSSEHYSAACPSKKDYKVKLVGSDLRTGVNLIYKNHTVKFQPVQPFHAGKVIEWRYQKSGGVKYYHAIIYRVFTAQMDKDAVNFLPRSKDKQELVVVRLDGEKSCIVNVVSHSKDMNKRARKIADDNRSQCIDVTF